MLVAVGITDGPFGPVEFENCYFVSLLHGGTLLSTFDKPIVIVKGDAAEDKPITVYTLVYPPMQLDTQKEAATPEAMYAAMVNFMAEARTKNVDFLHDETPTGSLIIESYWVPEGHPWFPPENWAVAIQVSDPELKSAWLKGELGAVSWGGSAFSVKKPVVMKHPVKSVGTVELSNDDGPLPIHDHEAMLFYDADANILPGKTKETFGHAHETGGPGTTTGMAFGHAHGLMIVPAAEA